MRSPLVVVLLGSSLLGCTDGEEDTHSAGTGTGAATESVADESEGAGPASGSGDGATSTNEGTGEGPVDSSDGGGGLSQTAACAAYLACATVATPAELGELLETYGPEGSCWASTDEVADQCDLACMAGLEQLQEAFGDEPACGGTGSTDGPSGEPGPPVITGVTWMADVACTVNTGSDFFFVIEVEDPDDAIADLTFSGLAIGCSGEFDGEMPTLFCPNVADYSATVTVADPAGNQDSLDFMFGPCSSGSAP